jgi:alkaline phosphatase D
LSFLGQVEAKNPDLVLMMGDNVYGSYTPKDPNLPSLREAYAKLAEVPAFKSLVSKVSTQAVWDDHDYGINDGGGDFAYKAQAQTMFNQFWNMPANSPLRQRPGIYRAFQAGPKGEVLQVIMLDTRYFRAPLLVTDQRDVPGKERYIPHPVGSGADVLGEAQWAFLKAELEKPADVRLIVSSIQVVADGHGYERWGNFPDSQKRLYDLIAQTGAKGVVFASGDRHYGSINQIRDGVAYPLTDITASAINMPFRVAEGTTSYNEPATTRIGDGYAAVNFGLIEINWAAGTLSLNLIGEGGTLARSTSLDLKNLRRN